MLSGRFRPVSNRKNRKTPVGYDKISCFWSKKDGADRCGLAGRGGVGHVFAEGTAAGQAEAQSGIAEIHWNDSEKVVSVVAT